MKLDRIHDLIKVLRSRSIQLPVYTRFQTPSGYHTIPVTSVELTDDCLKVENANDSPQEFLIRDLVDVVTFVDGNGKPVFLTGPSNGRDILEEIREEEEEKIHSQLIYRLKHQHEYRSIEDERKACRRMVGLSAQPTNELLEYDVAA